MTILVTVVAGFIGFQLARKRLQKGQDVVGLDNVNDYYDVSLKEARLRELEEVQGFRFMRAGLKNIDKSLDIAADVRPN